MSILNGLSGIVNSGESVPISFARDCEINVDSPIEFQLLQAAAGGHTQELQALLKQEGIDVNVATKRGVCGDSGRTALSLAAENGYDDTCSALIDAGADVNVTDLMGHAPLFYAVVRGNVECVQVLIAAKANLEQKPLNKTSTALWVALDQSKRFKKTPEVADRFNAIAEELKAAGAKPIKSCCTIL